MKFNQEQFYWAEVFVNNEFLCIETYSGDGLVGRDLLFSPHLLLPNVDDKTIEKTIMQAFSDSRILKSDSEEYLHFFDLEEGEARYAAWIAMLMEKYGYKTKRALLNRPARQKINWRPARWASVTLKIRRRSKSGSRARDWAPAALSMASCCLT